MTGKEQIDAHIAALPPEQRNVMERLRQIVLDEAPPDAEEVIAYKMPSLRAKGKYVLSYEAFKDHYSFFPMSGQAVDAHRDELGERVTGKGTIRFEYDRPLPKGLVKKVVRARLAEATARRTKRT